MDDLISRKAFMNHVEKEYMQWGSDYDIGQVLGDLEDFPSIRSEKNGAVARQAGSQRINIRRVQSMSQHTVRRTYAILPTLRIKNGGNTMTDETTITTEQAMLELLDKFNEALIAETGKGVNEIVKLGMTGGWHVLPSDPPPAGEDVILQYRTKTGDLRTCISRWTGQYWSGKIYHPQAWHDLPEPYHVPIIDGEDNA